MGIRHAYFLPVYWLGQHTRGAVIQQGDSLLVGIPVVWVFEPLHCLIVDKVSVGCVGGKTVLLRQYKLPVLIFGHACNDMGVAELLGFGAGEVAKPASGGVVGSCRAILGNEVHGDSSKL